MENLRAGQYKLTRQLPKTGQIIEYQAGDDGTYEAGWWLRRLNANNRTRWIARTIGGDDIVLDRATGLMWAADGNAAGANNGAVITWANAIVYANGLNFAGFTDWRVPNGLELASLIHFAIAPPCINQAFFPNTKENYYHSSTTRNSLTTMDVIINYAAPVRLSTDLKTVERYIRCVRKGV